MNVVQTLDSHVFHIITLLQKMSFLNTVGLTTHAHAQEVELNLCERRAHVLNALQPSSLPSSPKHNEAISEELMPMLAPGHSLPPVITTPEELCLAHEYPHKARFLHHLGLQPQHSLHRQQGIHSSFNGFYSNFITDFEDDMIT